MLHDGATELLAADSSPMGLLRLSVHPPAELELTTELDKEHLLFRGSLDEELDASPLYA